MSNSPASPRGFTVAITAAVASTTLAVGVTAASMIGWLTPALTSPPTSSASTDLPVITPVIMVPIVPNTPADTAPPAIPVEPTRSDADLQLAMDERHRGRERKHQRGHHDHHEDGDHEDDDE